MAPSNTSDIVGLQAFDKSRQTSIIQNAQNINIHLFMVKVIGKKDQYLSPRQHQQEYAEALQAYLGSTYHGSGPPRPVHLHSDIVPAVNGVDTTNDHATNRLPHSEGPEGLSWIDDDMPLCIKQYPLPVNSQMVLHVLENYEIKKIKTWRDTSEQNVLIVSRSTRDEPESDWRTDLTLEIMGGILRENDATQQHRPVMVHFCKQHADKKNWELGRSMVQDFISQLLRRSCAEDGRASAGPGRSNGRSHEILDDPTELWNRLEKCIIHTKAKTIFVLIDNITWMFEKMGEPGFRESFNRLGRVCQELKSFDITIKVMVTCSKKSSSAIGEYFVEKEVTHLSLEDQPSSLRLPDGVY